MKKPKTKLGMILRLYRIRNNLSAREFAVKIPLDRAYLSRIETGDVIIPTARTLRRMAQLKNLPAEDKAVIEDMIKHRLETRTKAKKTAKKLYKINKL